MRNFLTASLVALALIFFLQTPTAFADAAGSADGAVCDVVPNSGAADGQMQNGKCIAKANFVSQSNSAAAQTPIPLKADSQDSVMNSIMSKIATLFAWLVGVAALALDYAVYYTVLNMGNYVRNITAIGVTWRILRDIGNIMLIFGFLVIGITTILNVSWYGGGKKLLPKLLAAAVFLNFSLFFSEAIIDVGNLFATQFFTAINGGNSLTTNSAGLIVVDPNNPNSPVLGTGKEGISNKLLDQLGLQTLYSNAQSTTTLFKDANPWYIGFMGIALFIVTAFVMFSLAFILIARLVMLIFLIILAPVGFAGFAVPQLAGKAKLWWDTLILQTITAPVLLLVLYIALQVITDARFLIPGSATGFVENSNLPAFANYLISFMIAIGLMFAVTISAKKLGAAGASGATKLAGKLVFGATAAGMRATVGRGADYAGRKLRTSKSFNKFDAMTGGRTSRIIDRTAKGNFDIRGTKALQSIGINAGEAQKGGYTEARKQNIKRHEEATKAIEEAHKDSFSERDREKAIKRATAEAESRDTAVRQIYGQTKPVLEKEVKEHRATAQQHEEEVQRLEKEEQLRVKFGIQSTPQDLQKMASARDNLASSKANLSTSEAKLANVEQKLSESAENLKKVTEEAIKNAGDKALKENIKTSKTAYAEGLNSPVGFVLSGSGSNTAARKIKDSLNEKSKKDKAYEAMKAALEETEGTKNKKEENSTAKPEKETNH